MIRVSIVMPTLNEERGVERALLRALASSCHEIVVVDGGSRDRTCDLVASVQATSPCVRVVVSEPGRAGQMNAGAALCSGDVLLFLHADTLLPEGAVAAMERALNDARCVGGRFDVAFDPDTGWGWLIARMMNWRSRWSGIATGDQALFVRREIFQRLGGFPDLPLMEDVELSRRLKREGRLASLPIKVVTSYRRWEQGGPLRTILRMWTLRTLYWLGIDPRVLAARYGHVR
jgi:rSAM/selenodomain-associated transferase 2